MRLSYNTKLNVAYLYFRDSPETVTTVELAEDLFLDVGPDGEIYGLELLNAKVQLRAANLAELEVENEESGETTRVRLPFPPTSAA